MENDWISVIDVGRRHGKRKATVFKILKRLGIETRKLRTFSSKNQLTAHISQAEFERVSAELVLLSQRNGSVESDDEESEDFVSTEEGVFYLIQLEPELDPGRFKVGFAASMPERLRHLRCSAPFATVLRTWASRRLWEKTAIDSVVVGCERLHTEVFRTGSLDEIIARCERFFSVMPTVDSNSLGNQVEVAG